MVSYGPYLCSSRNIPWPDATAYSLCRTSNHFRPRGYPPPPSLVIGPGAHTAVTSSGPSPLPRSLASQPNFSLFPVGGARGSGREKYIWTFLGSFPWTSALMHEVQIWLVRSKLNTWLPAYQSAWPVPVKHNYYIPSWHGTLASVSRHIFLLEYAGYGTEYLQNVPRLPAVKGHLHVQYEAKNVH